MVIVKIGGSYLSALFNQVGRNWETGRIESRVERIFGADEVELWERIRQRFPKYRVNQNRPVNKQPWRRK